MFLVISLTTLFFNAAVSYLQLLPLAFSFPYNV